MNPASVNLAAGWIAMFFGVLSGAAIGLFFHREDWLGGYATHRRRLIRLGHISFFGLGFLNLFYAFSLATVPLELWVAKVASIAFVVAVVTMPICCFLSAWRKPFRHLFPIPVLATTIGILGVVFGGIWR